MKSKLLILTFLLACSYQDMFGQWNPQHPSWTDSYKANGLCWCKTTFDHDLDNINKVWFVINGVRRNIRDICDELKKHPQYRNYRNGDNPYNDIQCGNGPANTAPDEAGCPGRTDIGPGGCQQKGPRWAVAWLSGRPRFNGGGGGGGGSTAVQLRKRNAMNYAVDGNVGGANGQNVYLWSQNSGNVNQQWVEISRGNNFFSYKKKNTNYCLDGGNGGANGQNVYLWTCNSGNQNQHWKKVNLGGGNYRLEKRNASSYSIDGGNGGGNGQNLYLWSSNNSNQNQHWQFASTSRVGDEQASTSSDLKVYPNPTSGDFSVSGLAANESVDINVYSSVGRVVINQSAQTSDDGDIAINAAGLQVGVYFVSVSQGGTNKVLRLVKE